MVFLSLSDLLHLVWLGPSIYHLLLIYVKKAYAFICLYHLESWDSVLYIFKFPLLKKFHGSKLRSLLCWISSICSAVWHIPCAQERLEKVRKLTTYWNFSLFWKFSFHKTMHTYLALCGNGFWSALPVLADGMTLNTLGEHLVHLWVTRFLYWDASWINWICVAQHYKENL